MLNAVNVTYNHISSYSFSEVPNWQLCSIVKKRAVGKNSQISEIPIPREAPSVILGTMVDKDRKKWDSRYLENLGNSDPSLILQDYLGLATCGNALDIACGNGRNSLFLVKKGFIVDAVDISTVATSHLAGSDPKINVICQDIDDWTIPQNRYELIVNIRFLDRRLFPMIIDGLRPGGVLIFESFIDEKKDTYCLRKNELLHAFQSFHIVYYEEKKSDDSDRFDQTVSLVAIKTDLMSCPSGKR